MVYAHEVVKRETGHDLIAARCFTVADVEIVLDWLFRDLLLQSKGCSRRDGEEGFREDSRFASFGSPPPTELPSLLDSFDSGLPERLERIDELRDDLGGDGGATQWDVAQFAAWVHGEMLRLRPFREGNLFAAYLATWWAVRLCGFMIPVSHPRNDEYMTRSRYAQFDAAVEDALIGPLDHDLGPLEPQPRDQLMAGFLAAQIGTSRGFRRFHDPPEEVVEE